jgi:hypothetical protein
MKPADPLGVGDLDGRRRAVKRAKALVREFTDALGGQPAPHQVIMIRSAAELSAVAEAMRARMLAGQPIASNDLVRTQNAAQRALDALGIPAGPARPTEDFADTMVRLATPQASVAADDADRRMGEAGIQSEVPA